MQTPARRVLPLLLSLLLSLLVAATVNAAEKVNINTADAATIDRVMVNIGRGKAEAIVAYRKANGPFRSAEQLAKVKGVGLKTVEKNLDRIVLSGAAAVPVKPVTAGKPAPAKPAAVRPVPKPAAPKPAAPKQPVPARTASR
ncbi:MAG TPA: helix-hairpin-helix domain-containing protein [Lysobacter sp.]